MEKREDYKRPSLNSTDSIRTEFSLGTGERFQAYNLHSRFSKAVADGKFFQIVYLARHNPQNIDTLCQNANDLANFAVFFNCLSSGMLFGHGGKMNSNKNKGANHLWIARKKRRFSQKQVARLLGHKSTATLSKYEGGRPPPLVIAIKLAVVYQSSVEELFPGLHREIKVEVLKAQLTNARASLERF